MHGKDYSILSFIELKSLLKTQKDAIATYLKLAEKPGADPRFSKYAQEREQIVKNIEAEIEKRIIDDAKESRA